MRIAVLVTFAACSSTSPETARTANPRDAGAQQPIPSGRESTPALAKAPPCGEAGGVTPPKPVVQLVAASESCARLTDGTVWCWGGRGHVLDSSHSTAPLACAVATRIEEFGVADALWSMGRDTCATGKGISRCAVVTVWGFSAEVNLGTRTTFYWSGLPCGITKDARVRCYADQ
jgi:hypothetical protein